jgi:methyl-accepting chemotaxis protein
LILKISIIYKLIIERLKMKKVERWIVVSLGLTFTLMIANVVFYLTQSMIPTSFMLIITLILSLTILVSVITLYLVNKKSFKVFHESLKKIVAANENEKKIDTTLTEIQNELKPLVHSLNLTIEKLKLIEKELDILEKTAEASITILEEISKFNLDVEIPEQPGLEPLKEIKVSLMSKIRTFLENSSKLVSEISRDREINRKLENVINSINERQEDIKSQIQNLVVLAEKLKAVMKIHEELREIEKVTSTFSNTFSSSKQKLETINNQFEEMVNSSNSLIKEIDEISETSNIIKEISEQTLLLSMNALIESSKAGEYGKGFAVIAEEIRKLSTSISSLSDTISSKTKTMRGNLNKILLPTKDSQENLKQLFTNIGTSTQNLEKLETIRKRLSEITEVLLPSIKTLDEMKEVLTQNIKISEILVQNLNADIQKEINKLTANKIEIIIDQNEKTFKRFKVTSHSKQIFQAKLTHMLFNITVENYIESKKDISKEELEKLGDYTICDLGMWYYSVKQNYPNIPAFVKLEKIHKEYHETGRMALEFLIKNSEEKAMEYLSKNQKLSLEIIEILDELDKELSAHENAE